MAAQRGLQFDPFDIKVALLYGKLDDIIHIKKPDGLQDGSDKDQIYRLNKALYGRKQASLCWNQTFCDFLKRFGFVKCETGWSVFVCRDKSFYLALYVDDGTMFGESMNKILSVIEAMRSEFEIKIGTGKIFVGMQIESDRKTNSIILHQSTYTRRIIEKFCMSDCYPTNILADPGLELRASNSAGMPNVPYCELIGSLMFLSTLTRPELSFEVSLLSHF